MSRKSLRNTNCRYLLTFGLVLCSLLVATCGGESTTERPDSAAVARSTGYQRIQPLDRVYTVDEVVTAGFKRSKAYNVEGLQGATAAIYGFYGPDPYSRKEYEIRFYPSHGDAIQLGVPMAEESVGEKAKLLEDEATWDEGLKERRECQGNVRGSHHIGKCLNPKYQDMVVYANMVILCQGREAAESQQSCNDLLMVLK